MGLPATPADRRDALESERSAEWVFQPRGSDLDHAGRDARYDGVVQRPSETGSAARELRQVPEYLLADCQRRDRVHAHRAWDDHRDRSRLPGEDRSAPT